MDLITQCIELSLKEIEHFEKWCDVHGHSVHRPNSMNRYGAILDDMGMSDAIQKFIDTYVNSIFHYLYRENENIHLDHHHAFVVSYEIGKDEDLDLHVDDSNLTLNICLGRNFEGGSLFFGGIRCGYHVGSTINPKEEVNVDHTVGNCLIHLGDHRHAARRIESGERLNLIIWYKSSKLRTLDSDRKSVV